LKKREELTESGHYLAYLEGDSHITVHLTNDQIRLGRSMTADLRLDDPTVSRRHALLLRESGRIRLIDDRSLNGVFVNGERVQSIMLSDGDQITIGRYSLHFVALGATQTPSEPGDELESIAG
jgi:pSer/pThr/pTyr-binding forkhead associated (FHA) protein